LGGVPDGDNIVIMQEGPVTATPNESVTLTVKEKAPALVRVPVIFPVEVFNVSPDGKLPELIENV